MIKKVLCPTDFSDTGNNAISYAAKIAQTFSAELILFNVRPIGSPGSSRDHRKLLQTSEETLQALTKEVVKAFRISCSYQMKLTMQDFKKTLSMAGTKDALIVIGSNGADSIGQSIAGSNTFRLVKMATCPVWLVPEKWEYGTPHNILFVYSNNDISRELETARPFFELYHSDITFLKIADMELTAIETALVKEELRKMLPPDTFFSVESINAEDVSGKILGCAARNRANLLTICYHRTAFVNICRKDLVKTLTKRPFIPMLILPESNESLPYQ